MVENEKELSEVIKKNKIDRIDTIDVTGDFCRKLIKIKATGNVAWAIAIGAIGVAVAAVVSSPMTGGLSAGVALVAAPAAVSVLGVGATVSAISLSVAYGSTSVLKELREYKIIINSKTSITLIRKDSI